MTLNMTFYLLGPNTEIVPAYKVTGGDICQIPNVGDKIVSDFTVPHGSDYYVVAERVFGFGTGVQSVTLWCNISQSPFSAKASSKVG